MNPFLRSEKEFRCKCRCWPGHGYATIILRQRPWTRSRNRCSGIKFSGLSPRNLGKLFPWANLRPDERIWIYRREIFKTVFPLPIPTSSAVSCKLPNLKVNIQRKKNFFPGSFHCCLENVSSRRIRKLSSEKLSFVFTVLGPLALSRTLKDEPLVDNSKISQGMGNWSFFTRQVN